MLTEVESAVMQESELPKLVEDAGCWLFFKGRSGAEDTFIIGSVAADRYLTVPASKLAAIRSFMKRLDGSRTLDQIAHELLIEDGLRVDVSALNRKFRRAGLLANDGARRAGDIEGMSATIVRLPIDPLLRFLGRLAYAARPALYVGIALMAAALIVAAFNPSVLSLMKQPGAASQPFLRNALPATAIIISSVLAHELSHCFAAAAWGISRGAVRVQFYLGVIPMVGLKLAGLYTLPPAGRIAVWGAGVFTNLVIAAMALLMMWTWLPGSPVLHVAVTFNWVIAVFNLMPLLPTDGYFLLSTIVQDSNVRVRAWAWLRRPFQRDAKRPSWFVLAYMASTVWLLGSACWGLLRRALNLDATHPKWQSALALLMLVLFAVMLWRNFRKREEFD